MFSMWFFELGCLLGEFSGTCFCWSSALFLIFVVCLFSGGMFWKDRDFVQGVLFVLKCFLGFFYVLLLETVCLAVFGVLSKGFQDDAGCCQVIPTLFPTSLSWERRQSKLTKYIFWKG